MNIHADIQRAVMAKLASLSEEDIVNVLDKLLGSESKVTTEFKPMARPSSPPLGLGDIVADLPIPPSLIQSDTKKI